MNRYCLLVAGLFVIVLGCSGGKTRFDNQTRAILASAGKVEVFRTDGEAGPYDRKPRQDGGKRIGGFRVISQAPDQARPFAVKLAALLLDETNYNNNYAKCYWPGVAFRVWKDEEFADVLICFKCDNLYCGPATEEAKENASFYKSPARSQLARLAKEALPDDAEIQGLKEE
jgi:hypothetical protein